MMKQTLKQRIGTGIVLAAAGLGGLVGLGGCETQEEAMMGSLIGTMGMMSPNATPNEAMAFAGIRDVSQNSLNSYNAEKSRAQVNVNVRNEEGFKEELVNNEGSYKIPYSAYFIIYNNATRERKIIPGVPDKLMICVDKYLEKHKDEYPKKYYIELYDSSPINPNVHLVGKVGDIEY